MSGAIDGHQIISKTETLNDGNIDITVYSLDVISVGVGGTVQWNQPASQLTITPNIQLCGSAPFIGKKCYTVSLGGIAGDAYVDIDANICLRPTTSPQTGGSARSSLSKIYIIIGGVIGAIVLVACLGLGACLNCKKKMSESNQVAYTTLANAMPEQPAQSTDPGHEVYE